MSLIRTVFITAVACLALAACGGDDSSNGSDSGGTTTTSESAGDSTGDGDDAKALFAASCGGCHALSDAGTTGSVGPNLDELKSSAKLVATQIENGGGAMPAGLLEGEQKDAVAAYVAEAAGK